MFPVLTVATLREYELKHRSSPSSGQARPASRTCKRASERLITPYARPGLHPVRHRYLVVAWVEVSHGKENLNEKLHTDPTGLP